MQRATSGASSAVPWRLQDTGRPRLVDLAVCAAPVSAPPIDQIDIVDGCTTWYPGGAGSCISFPFDHKFAIAASFLARRAEGQDTSPEVVVEYADQDIGPWFSVWEGPLSADEVVQTIQWPDVGGRNYFRIRTLDSKLGCCAEIRFYRREWGEKLTDAAHFSRVDEDSELYASLSLEGRRLASDGYVLVGDGDLLSQLYHESDLLGWGVDITFPCFMTLWAKEATPHDFGVLVHRFLRTRSPLLLMSGTSHSEREKLWQMLKPLLRPEFAEWVSDILDPSEVVEELWLRWERMQDQLLAPALPEVNARLHQAYERLQVPAELRQESYSCQFHKRDPLMLLLTKEAFGTWAPNRVADEIQGRDIFRTFAQFSCVDGIVCADDAVWMHAPVNHYAACSDPIRGDKRTAEYFALLERQRPYLSQLLAEYEQKELVTKASRTSIEQSLLCDRVDGGVVT